ncbi:MAG: hypothetical protein Q9227_006671 [Pyrenula ochraceoflavens]
MPYTPPAQHTPKSSQTSSPSLSRSHSYLKDSPANQSKVSPERPSLPRSTSSSQYLSRHRRTPSINKTQPTTQVCQPTKVPSASTDTGSQDVGEHNKLDPNGSLRSSPPPVTNLLMPSGAVISPPDSSHNSSDDEENMRGRIRELGVDNMVELQAAIRKIEQRREGSPDTPNEDNEKIRLALSVAPELTKSLSAPVLHRALESSHLPLSREARKISHSRSSTDSGILLDLANQVQSPMQMTSGMDEEDSDEAQVIMKPQMVRKKSGELVKPALRPASIKRRPSSMPGTPTYSKAVHFDSNLEHVRHFLQVERPLAVSAGSSPVDNYENEVEFPFGSEKSRNGGPPFEWEIRLPNFPSEVADRRRHAVRVERIYLSSDKQHLVGSIAVQNIAFHKNVVARFTLDYWKTTSEIVAEYNNDVRKKQVHDGCDRFTFSIKIADQANLENKTLFFCIRYNVNGQEFWDNNSSLNYQVDFSKKYLPQNGKNGMTGASSRPLNALPRSGRPSPPISDARPHTAPSSFDDFGTDFDDFSTFGHGHSPIALIGESPLKLKAPRGNDDIVPDAPTRRQKGNNPQAFGHRYDFGASMKAAMGNATSALGEKSGLKSQIAMPVPEKTGSATHVEHSTESNFASENEPQKADHKAPNKPSALVSEKPSHQSLSYQELVNKYCFFGSSKSSPQLTKSTPGLMDGASDEPLGSDSGSGESSPLNAPPSTRPALPERVASSLSPPISRSISPTPISGPGVGGRSPSPSFGYPYPSSMQNGFFTDAHAPTAIRG